MQVAVWGSSGSVGKKEASKKDWSIIRCFLIVFLVPSLLFLAHLSFNSPLSLSPLSVKPFSSFPPLTALSINFVSKSSERPPPQSHILYCLLDHRFNTGQALRLLFRSVWLITLVDNNCRILQKQMAAVDSLKFLSFTKVYGRFLQTHFTPGHLRHLFKSLAFNISSI